MYGSQVILIDPANEIERDSNPEATGKMIQELKALADRYRVLILCVAHPPVEIVRKRKAEDLWTLYDVEGGRHWAGKSDSGFMLWRLGEHTMLYAAKMKRFDDYGSRTLYQLAHDRPTNRLTAVAKGDHLLKQAATAQAMGVKAAKPNGGYTYAPRQSDD